MADICQLPMQRVGEVLSTFTGAHRRFERTSITDGVQVYTDYGHNPAEIRNALHIAKLQPHKTLWSVWQPHTYSRTKTLFDGFMETFDEVDKVVITDICLGKGREEVDPTINSQMLVEGLRARGVNAVHTPSFDDTEEYMHSLHDYIKKELPMTEEVELLPFHKMGAHKYASLGLFDPLADTPAMDKERTKELKKFFSERGYR